jgi:hypothetical protein
MNILWIEDFGGGLDSGKATLNLMFQQLISFENWDEDELSLLSRPDDLEKYFQGNTALHCVFLCRNYYDYLEFKTGNNLLGKVDAIIIDIRLHNNVDLNLPIPSNVHTNAKFHEEAGFYIFNDLVRLGFPAEMMCFMTGETNSFSGFKKHCDEIYIPEVTGFEKSDTGYVKLRQWIEERGADYVNLRRGVIEGCKLAKLLPPERLYFNKYILNQDGIKPDEIISYFEILENFLPLREPGNKQAIYKLFVRTLSHEWEAAKNIRPDKEKHDAVLAWIMRNTRHWITHNSSLFDELDERFVAFIFMVNLRVMFKFDDYQQHPHECILLKLFDNQSLTQQDFLNKTLPVSNAYLALRNIVWDENSKIHEKNKKSGSKDKPIDEAFYFNDIANNVQLSESPLRHEKEIFIQLLYQTFWLTTCNPFVDKKNKQSLEIKFWNFNYSDKPYMLEIARSIYHRSFPET